MIISRNSFLIQLKKKKAIADHVKHNNKKPEKVERILEPPSDHEIVADHKEKHMHYYDTIKLCQIIGSLAHLYLSF